MDQATGGQLWLGILTGLSSLGFYLFLAVWVASVIWSGTGEVKTSPQHAASSIPRPT